MELLSPVFGWLGTALIFGAYLLNSLKKVDSDSRAYQLMNLLGAAALGVNVYVQRAWPALALEFVWGGIAIISLLASIKKRG